MRNLSLFFILFLLTIHPCQANNELDSLFIELDNKIKKKDIYIELKEIRIKELKTESNSTNLSINNAYALNTLLYKEYKSYISDSAIAYLNKNLDLAAILKDQTKINDTSIAMANLFAILGMYKEAIDMIDRVNRDYLDKSQMIEYYSTQRIIYNSLGLYSHNNRDKSRYQQMAKAFRDTLSNIADKSSEAYLRIEEIQLRIDGRISDALLVNNRRLSMTVIGTPEYALVTFNRSLLYRKNNDTIMEKKYLILSAISDIQSSIRDNASIPILANMLMQEGNIDRAYKYVRFSLDNINDYNTRFRSSEILSIQTIIEKAYQKKTEEQNNKLRLFLILISILLVLLTVSIFYVYKQMKKGIIIGKRLKEANLELNTLNQKLHNMNNELRKLNMEVVEANQIKEEYIGYFLDECSKYIDKLDALRKTINKKIQEKQIESLYKMTKNNNMKDDELKELFRNFDIMFTHLFPDFVEKFNSLLMDEEQISLKKGETLNNELRIYALIRLGIDDSGKIANFLGYSVNTIYNYRAKTKNKAKISREDFDWTVKKIGTFRK
ncbi:transcriptional regulator [Dysgonomonas sp. HDW5A]|uniref:DUF6377 domain-containing protein n=1 Tax=Dysgonomonas sp. HDW5A TaxID=2714926 RepID=UPI00140B702D|nr:DUF6377 domain-containing protein [Dysgonomonas sp. HDW5A]QIK60328.1 transcriptional regulator [Dysgonomonas sp. HDW5A]